MAFRQLYYLRLMLMIALVAVLQVFTIDDASAATLSKIAIYRFETSGAASRFYSTFCSTPDSGCQDISQNNGQVFTGDEAVGSYVSVQGAQDQEQIEWRFFQPNGSLNSTQTVRYDRATDCWSFGFNVYCGDPTNPYLENIVWLVTSSTHCGVIGAWRIEVRSNGTTQLNDPFDMVQRSSGPLQIKSPLTSPTETQDFDLGPMTSTATNPITFEAQVTPPAPVNWEVTLEYETSGHRGPFSDQRTFQTRIGQTHQETYQSMGGQMKVIAQAVINGQTVRTCETIATITGVVIPSSDITDRLVSLYNRGETPRLLTGIAMKESTYRQFCIPGPPGNCTGGQSALYNKPNEDWPLESYDGGSHVGLMQMPITMPYAWNWQENTASAADLFREKISIARSLMRRIIRTHRGLRHLTNLEIENMALVLYGPHASGNLGSQYYVPQRTASGDWDWVVNTNGNPSGVAYANDIRSRMQ